MDNYIISMIISITCSILFAIPVRCDYKTSANYVYIPTAKTWADGQHFCQDQFGSHLASIHNEAQNAEVYSIKDNSIAWVGFNDIGTERTWVWADNSDNGYSNWYPGQPDNSRGGDCAYIGYRGTPKWDDTACGYAFPFVCNRYPTPPPIYTTSDNYFYVPIAKKWTEADQYCQDAFGTHLAAIHDADKNAEVFNIKGNGGAWVGFNDISTERTWVWVDKSEKKYSNWYPGQPDNSRGGDCAYIGYRGTPKWDDTACGHTFPFVCNRYDESSP